MRQLIACHVKDLDGVIRRAGSQSSAIIVCLHVMDLKHESHVSWEVAQALSLSKVPQRRYRI